MVQVKPEYSPSHSECHPDYSPPTITNSPHTAASQFDSPNSNPQMGHSQLDYIPLLASRPSAPPSTMILMAGNNAKCETIPLLHAHAPVSASSFYPAPSSSNQQQQEQPHYEVTFVDAISIDMSKKSTK
ncbi:MAG: hypothetical protein BYD32DRAFT_452902 [Podila humilis]|nr:MAG: hypothetical protein BYD32DRAFT_452902 [Podila humilis]